MEQSDRVIETFVRLVNQYHELRDRDGIDAPATEWARAEISGARILLETAFGDAERERVFAEVRRRTGKGVPHRDREWQGWDSEAQRER
jgi:hypothetical protein